MDITGHEPQPAQPNRCQLRSVLFDLLLVIGMDPQMGYVRQVDAVTHAPDPEFQAEMFLQRSDKQTATRASYPAYGMIAWLVLMFPILSREWDWREQVLYFVLLAVTAGGSYIGQRRLKRLKEQLQEPGLAEFWLEKLLRDPDDIGQILRYTPWPWGRVFLGLPPQSQLQHVKLLTHNFSWYLHPPRLYLRWDWLCCALSLLLLLQLIAGLAAGRGITQFGVLTIAPLLLLIQLIPAVWQFRLLATHLIRHIHGQLSAGALSRAV